MSWSWLRGWGGNEAEASWEQHLASNTARLFWHMWGARQFWLSISQVKVHNQISTAASIFAASSHNHQLLPSHKLGWRIPLQAEDGERLPVAPDQQWQMCHVLPQKSAVMCFSPLSWRSLEFCMLGHTERKVRHAAFLLKRAFPSSTKYGSRHKCALTPLVFPGVIWSTENSGGNCSLVSTPDCFPPTVGRPRAGRMGRIHCTHCSHRTPTQASAWPLGSLCSGDLMDSHKEVFVWGFFP